MARQGVLRALYLYSGARRRGVLAATLRDMAKDMGLRIDVVECDVSQGSIAVRKTFDVHVRRAAEGRWDVVIACPPCRTFSRAPWLRRGRGPRALRARLWLDGFPWLRGASRAACRWENDVWDRVVVTLTGPFSAVGKGKFVIAAPEDLGATRTGGRPASAWRRHAVSQALKDAKLVWGAVALMDYGSECASPVRFVTNSVDLGTRLDTREPIYDKEGIYSGPLRVGPRGRSGPRTSSWPRKWCEVLATALLGSFSGTAPSASSSEAAAGSGAAASTCSSAQVSALAGGAVKYRKIDSGMRVGVNSFNSDSCGYEGYPLRAEGKGLDAEIVVVNDGDGDYGDVGQGLATKEVSTRRKVTQEELRLLSQGSLGAEVGVYIGRGGRGGVPRSKWANPYKVGVNGSRTEVIALYGKHLHDSGLHTQVGDLRGRVLLCHCREEEPCHGDVLLEALAVAPSETALFDDGLPVRIPDIEVEALADPAAVAELSGSALLGSGPPRTTKMMGRRRPFADGGGLCSPGRWPPARRRLFDVRVRGFFVGLERVTRDFVQRHLGPGFGILDWVLRVAAGRYKTSPLDEVVIEEARQVFIRELGDLDVPANDSIDFKLIKAFLVRAGDPDTGVFDDFVSGVNLGVTEPLPRTPAVFEEKVRWSLDLPTGVAEDEVPNYVSVVGHEEAVEELFRAEAALGWMEEFSDEEARRRFGERLRVAALGVVVEKDKIRVVHDGSNRVEVNNHIRPRDQQRCPGAGELRTLLTERRTLGLRGFAVVGDVSKAHRRIPVRQEDWGFQACRLVPGKVWVNKVGTYGVASAAYWWSRFAAAGIVRLAYYLVGHDSLLDILIYVDDIILVAGCKRDMERIGVLLIAFAALRIPFGWKKFRGGAEVQWVGYTVNFDRYHLGISESRALWLANWMADRVREKEADLGDFSAVLGRLCFALGPLEYVRPFVAPLFAWVSAVGHRGRAPLPWSVCFLLDLLIQRFRGDRRVVEIFPVVHSLGTAFRADAKAEGNEVCVGGWECIGGTPTGSARWFSLKLSRTSAPWAFARGEPFRAIASLELFGSLLCVMLFGDAWPQGAEGRVALEGYTDNQGNQAVLTRLMTSKFPLVAILAEFAEQLEARRMDLELTWVPRGQNIEADALTNGDFALFDPARRLDVDAGSLPWRVLPKVLASAERLYEEVQQAKKQRHEQGGRQHGRPRPPSDRLRARDPWQ